MAVLTDGGTTVCDANLRLTLTTPSGKLIEPQVDRRSSCGPTTITNKADYVSAWPVHEIGEWQMRLDRLDEDASTTIYSITDTFEVRENVPFDVERVGPTRIYPLADYQIALVINPNEAYSATIIETVTSTFEILD